MQTSPLRIFNVKLIILALAAKGSIAYAMPQPATELARINNSIITLEDFNRKYQENSKFFPINPPSKKSVLDELIKRELGIQEAKRLGLDRSPEIIDKINTVLYHAFLEKKLLKEFEKISISDEDARKYFEKNPEIRTSHIFVALSPEAGALDEKQAFERIKKIRDRLLKDSKISFAEIAQRFSDGPSAPMGGDLDFQSKEKLDPVYYEAAIGLKKAGATSDIVRTKAGYHIIKLTAIRRWEDTDKPQAKRQAFERERARVFESYMEQLKKQAKVKIHADRIEN